MYENAMQEGAQICVDVLTLFDAGQKIPALQELASAFKADPVTGALAFSHVTQSLCLRPKDGVKWSHWFRTGLTLALEGYAFELKED